jgi:hypothetical protein
MKLVARFLILTTLSLTVGVAWSQDAGWPRVVKDGLTEVVVFQPQPDPLEGVTLHSRVAVSIKRPQDKAPLLPEFRRQIASNENALSVLLGRNPGAIERASRLPSSLIRPKSRWECRRSCSQGGRTSNRPRPS